MRKAAIVGSGEAAAGWAARFLLNGWDVAVTGEDGLSQVLDQARRVLPMLYEISLNPEGKLTIASAEDAYARADCAFLVTESALAAASDVPIFTTFSSDDPRTIQIAPIGPAYLHPIVRLDTRYTHPEKAVRAKEILADVGMAHDDADPPEIDTTENRDRVLVAILRALKRENAGAGRVIAAHEKTLDQSMPATGPLVTVRRVIPSDWTDYNGHMNESRYGQIWSDAADKVLLEAGLDEAYLAAGGSYFTAETKTNFLNETMAGESIICETRITLVDGRKLRVFHEMKRAADGKLLATCDQFLLHVSLETRRSCPPDPQILARLEAMKDRA